MSDLKFNEENYIVLKYESEIADMKSNLFHFLEERDTVERRLKYYGEGLKDLAYGISDSKVLTPEVKDHFSALIREAIEAWESRA